MVEFEEPELKPEFIEKIKSHFPPVCLTGGLIIERHCWVENENKKSDRARRASIQPVFDWRWSDFFDKTEKQQSIHVKDFAKRYGLN